MTLVSQREIAAPRSCQLISDLYIHSPSTSPRLRIGVALDSSGPNRVVSDILNDLARCDFADIVLIIYVSSDNRPLPRSSLLLNAYTRLDKWRLKTGNDPFEPANCHRVLRDIDALSVLLDVAHGTEAARSEIDSKQLDVLVDLTTTHPTQHLGFPKYGTWEYSYSSPLSSPPTPADRGELFKDAPVTRAALLVRRGQCESTSALATAAFTTQPGVSLLLNQLQPYWSSTHLVIQKLWELHVYGWEFVESRMCSLESESGGVKSKNTELLCWLAPRFTKVMWERVTRAATGQERVLHWRIAVRAGENHIEVQSQAPNTSGFQWIESPKGHFYADPFVFHHDGKPWLFFEDYSHSTQRGVIACAELSPHGQLGEVQVSLSSRFHMSYPYIFEDDDGIYMLPETASANSICLFRCKRFPERWSLVREMFQGPGLDTSVCRHGGLWWFFTSLQDPRAYGVALYLFFSEDLLGKWYYHPANPISLDSRNARSAGRIFKHGNTLIRPSQSATPRYGYSFTFNEVVRLTPTEYEERPILSVTPNCFPGLLATHTYNRSGDIEVIDGQTLRDRRSLL